MHDCANELVQETVTNFWQTQVSHRGCAISLNSNPEKLTLWS